MNNGLIEYNICEEDDVIVESQPYAYAFASNGVWLHASKPGLSVRFQIAECEIRGLQPTSEIFDMELPKVPLSTVEEMIRFARREALADQEILFHMLYESGWNLCIPEQKANSSSCRPVETGEGTTHARAFIECHSHHNMRAWFSSRDNEDESTGFRIYAVLGDVLKNPKIKVRVGCHGYFWVIDPSWVFEMPEGLKSSNAE